MTSLTHYFTFSLQERFLRVSSGGGGGEKGGGVVQVQRFDVIFYILFFKKGEGDL